MEIRAYFYLKDGVISGEGGEFKSKFYPLLFPLSKQVREGEQLRQALFLSPLSFSQKRGEMGEFKSKFYSHFYSPSLNEIEMGNN